MTHIESLLEVVKLNDAISQECLLIAGGQMGAMQRITHLRTLAQKLSCAAQELELRAQGVKEPVIGG